MNHETEWIRITKVPNIPLREGRSVKIAGREIALFNLGDRFLAIDNRCPHRGGPLAEGIVAGASVVCPLHAWKVALETGEVAGTGPSQCVSTYRTRVRDGVISVEIPATSAASEEMPANCFAHSSPVSQDESSAHATG